MRKLFHSQPEPRLEWKEGSAIATLDIDGAPGAVVEVDPGAFMAPGTPYQVFDGQTIVCEGVWHGNKIPVTLPATGVARYRIWRDEPGEVA